MIKLSLPESGVEREALNKELAAAGYNYSVAVLAREVDADGKAVLDANGRPVRVAPYVMVKTPSGIANAAKSAITKIVSDHDPS